MIVLTTKKLREILKETSEVKCPVCKGPLTEISDYKVGFVCPRCGFKKVK